MGTKRKIKTLSGERGSFPILLGFWVSGTWFRSHLLFFPFSSWLSRVLFCIVSFFLFLFLGFASFIDFFLGLGLVFMGCSWFSGLSMVLHFHGTTYDNITGRRKERVSGTHRDDLRIMLTSYEMHIRRYVCNESPI